MEQQLKETFEREVLARTRDMQMKIDHLHAQTLQQQELAAASSPEHSERVSQNSTKTRATDPQQVRFKHEECALRTTSPTLDANARVRRDLRASTRIGPNVELGGNQSQSGHPQSGSSLDHKAQKNPEASTPAVPVAQAPKDPETFSVSGSSSQHANEWDGASEIYVFCPTS